jgi:hypothetical protein
MTAPVLSGQTRQVKTTRERVKKLREQELLDAIPPELLLVRDNAIRYERNGPIYATDGKVAVLKRVVINESIGEVVELVVQTLDSERWVLLPIDLVDRSAGSALFLSVNHVQFADRAINGSGFEKSKFAKVDIKGFLKKRKRDGGTSVRRSIANAGEDFVETPAESPLDRLQHRFDATRAT